MLAACSLDPLALGRRGQQPRADHQSCLGLAIHPAEVRGDEDVWLSRPRRLPGAEQPGRSAARIRELAQVTVRYPGQPVWPAVLPVAAIDQPAVTDADFADGPAGTMEFRKAVVSTR